MRRYRLSRRTFVAGACVLTAPAAPQNALAAADGITSLRVEAVERPLGVEATRPRLSWRMDSNRNGARQTAYRIRVASSDASLQNPDLWDSGRTSSETSIGIRYAGIPLASRQRCYWQVDVWDEHDRLVVSDISWWEMGLLYEEDWTANWIAAEDQVALDDYDAGFKWIRGALGSDAQPTNFRLALEPDSTTEATLFVVADGAFRVWLDGTEVALPSTPSTLGLPPASVFQLQLTPGRHVLGISQGAPRLGALLGFVGSEIGLFLRLRDADGRITRVAPDQWKTSQGASLDWQSPAYDPDRWASAEVVTEQRPAPWPKQAATLMRCAFSLHKPVQTARLYVTALGAYRLTLNRARIGNAVLSPESADFRKSVHYRVHDLTALLARGENVLAGIVGDGWYASYTIGMGRYSWGPGPRRLCAQLEITFADGTRYAADTLDWRLSRSPILSSEIYDGEDYDARLEQPGWDAPGFEPAQWMAARPAQAPPCRRIAQISPPIATKRELVPQAITEPTPGVYVIDFGQNFAGWCKMRVCGAAGRRVTLRYGEVVGADGHVDQRNLRAARAADNYILRGDPNGESFEPHFTYHGFRYVELEGLPSAPRHEDFSGIVVGSDLTVTGDLRVDNPLISALWRNTMWSQRSNFVGIPTDCPQRDERLGWMGDAAVFWDAATFNMDVEAFTRKWMGDVRDAQADNGAYADFSPAPFWLPSPDGHVGPSPGWADAGISLPWTVWRRYGDVAIIEENWDAMCRYLALVLARNPDFIWRNNRGRDYGDWLALDAVNPGDPTTPKDLVATAVWAHSTDCLAEMAAATGRDAQALAYRDLWSNIVNAFQRNFIATDGTIGNGSQTGYILALRYRLVPESLRARVAALLEQDIRRRGTLLSTGFLGTPSSLDVLADSGLGSLVYDLLLRTEFPSWGYMVSKGATTIWERWNGDTGDVAMNSFNHYALGAVCGFLFRRIAGIDQLEPGFKRIAIKPVFDPRVPRGGATYRSAMGAISTQWEQYAGGGYTFDLAIPANTTALVSLPCTPGLTIREGGVPLTNPHVRVLGRDGVAAHLDVAAGSYTFAVV